MSLYRHMNFISYNHTQKNTIHHSTKGSYRSQSGRKIQKDFFFYLIIYLIQTGYNFFCLNVLIFFLKHSFLVLLSQAVKHIIFVSLSNFNRNPFHIFLYFPLVLDARKYFIIKFIKKFYHNNIINIYYTKK